MTDETNLFDMDLDAVEPTTTNDFSHIVPGVYRTRIKNIEAGLSSKVSTPYIRFNVEYINPEETKAVVEGKKASPGTRREYYLSAKALGFVREAVEAHGITWAEFTPNLKLALEALKSDASGEAFVQAVKDSVEPMLVGLEANTKVVVKTSTSGAKYNEIGGYIVEKATV